MIELTLLLTAVLLFLALKTFCSGREGISYAGRRRLSRLSGLRRKQSDIWAMLPFRKLLAATSRLIHMNEAAASALSSRLSKAGISLSPKEYRAKRILTVCGCLCLIAPCLYLRFYFGILIVSLALVFSLMKQRDALEAGVKKKEEAIAREMPRFVRMLCRSLQSDRDLHKVIASYRKVAGSELGSELDILLAELSSGNTQSALRHFETRLGTSDAFRLCSALQDISLGIDQTVTLSYIADDMARQAKETVRRELALRPGKMRRTYYPAIGVCIAMILYVLVVYVIHNLNSIL